MDGRTDSPTQPRLELTPSGGQLKIEIKFETLQKLSMVFETVIGTILDKNQCLKFDFIM